MNGETLVLGYIAIAWMAMILLAVAEISAVRRDELAAAVATALLWPISLCILIVIAVLDGFIRRPHRQDGDRLA